MSLPRFALRDIRSSADLQGMRYEIEKVQRSTAVTLYQGSRPQPLKSRPTIPPRRLAQIVKSLAFIKKSAEADMRYAKILAVIPTVETEAEVAKTVSSLLLQSREIDKIVVIVNGPGESDAAIRQLSPFFTNKDFSDKLIVELPDELNGLNLDGSSKGSKVGALNYAFRHYVYSGGYDFMLGMDADVEADTDMLHHLEQDILGNQKAAGVMARYSFKRPSAKDRKGKSASLINGQRHEFAVTGIKQQLRNYTSDILGGQATLFRVSALLDAVKETDGGMPWEVDSLVEDAQLTRVFQKLKYTCKTSAKARAWVGPMFTAHSWQKQRRKWQDGHLTDMINDFHPHLDRRRWRDQFALGWNLLLRVLFAVVLSASVIADQFVFQAIWLVPVGIAILQSLLVAIKIPNRSLREIVRALLFIPGEIYYIRTLSVWLDSVLLVVVINMRRDGWGNQARAESARRKTALSGWLVIASAVAVPIVLLLLADALIQVEVVSFVVTYLWWTVAILTIGSVLAMVWFIFRVVRQYRRIAP